MRKNLCCLILITTVIVSISGCSSKIDSSSSITQNESDMKSITELRTEAEKRDLSFKNLDFSETKFTIPDKESMCSIIFPVSTDSLDQQTIKFEKNIRKYAQMEEDADLSQYMMFAYWDDEKNDRIEMPLLEGTSEQLEKIQYLLYNDGHYSSCLVFSDFMLEMADYDLPTALTNETEDYSQKPYGYRLYELGDSVAVYELPEDDISDVSYQLADGEMALLDAVAYTEKHMKEDYYFVGSEFLDFHVYEVDVRKVTDEVYYYAFRLQAYYDDIPINKDGGVGIEAAESDDPLANEPFGTAHKASMLRCDTLDFIWSSCHNYETQEMQETYNEFISLESAAEKLSAYLSSSASVKIESVELLYQTEFQYESVEKREYGYIESIYCHPAYHFVVGNPGLLGYEHAYFDVDAINGDISTTAL